MIIGGWIIMAGSGADLQKSFGAILTSCPC
jgi:hypothetical protein